MRLRENKSSCRERNREGKRQKDKAPEKDQSVWIVS